MATPQPEGVPRTPPKQTHGRFLTCLSAPSSCDQVDPVALADMVTSGRTLDLSAVVLDSQFKEAIEWVGIHQLFRGSVVVDAGTVSSLPFGGLIYQVRTLCMRAPLFAQQLI